MKLNENKWVNEWNGIDEWMNEWLDEGRNVYELIKDKIIIHDMNPLKIDKFKWNEWNKWMSQWINEWMNQLHRMNGWMNGWNGMNEWLHNNGMNDGKIA